MTVLQHDSMAESVHTLMLVILHGSSRKQLKAGEKKQKKNMLSLFQPLKVGSSETEQFVDIVQDLESDKA